MKRQIFLTGALLIATAFYGCGQNLGQSINDLDGQDPVGAFEKPFETLGVTDESIEFDDADITGIEADPVLLSKVVLEPTPNSATTVPIVDPVPVPIPPVPIDPPKDLDCPTSLDTHFLRVRWGQIFRDNSALDAEDRAAFERKWMNWSGSLSVNSGKLTLVKTILFEKNGENAPGPDLMHNTTDRNVIAFDSYTLPHYDGLLVKYQRCMPGTIRPAVSLLPAAIVAVPDADIVPIPDEAMITFSAPGLLPKPFLKTFRLAELDKLYRNVNANHDSFHIQLLKRHDRCENGKGEIHGVWFNANERVGHIKGRVVSANGDKVGHIKGFFSKANENGEHKVVAKFIAHDGKFKGILIGTGKDGAFKAEILNRDKVKVGTVYGRYSEGNSSRKGVFNAIYEFECPVKIITPVPGEPIVPVVPVEPTGGVTAQ